MKTKSRYPFTLASTVGGSIGLVAAIGYSMATTSPDKQTPNLDQLKIERTAPDREGPLGGYAKIVEKAAPSVVSVLSTKVAEPVNLQNLPPGFRIPGMPNQPMPFGNRPSPRQEGLGSGVILTADGIILTNNHVIDGATEVKVALKDGGKSYPAEVVGRDPMTDLAILKIDATNLSAATLADSDVLLPGDRVLAIGSPFGLSETVTSGIVSAIGRNNVGIVGYEDYIQTDASINPGNSGGALVDNQGRVVGINTAILSRSGGNVGIGFAIPINMAIDIANRLMSDGSVERGYLGVMLGPLTPDLARAMKVETSGALVNDVMPDTAASEAGFEPGDVVVRLNDKVMDDMAALRLHVSRLSPGENAKFTVIRDGKTIELDATIGRLPNDLTAMVDRTNGKSEFVEGVKIESLTDSVRQRLNLGENVEGVVVTEVDPRSQAAQAGLAAGDVITEVARSQVTSVREAVAAMKQASNKMLLLRVTNAKGSRFVAVEMS